MTPPPDDMATAPGPVTAPRLAPASGLSMAAATGGAPLKTVHVRSWGCQMNVYDSQRMVDLLAPLGYRPVGRADGADIVIL